MMQSFYKHVFSLPLFFFSIGFVHAADNVNTPPPPLPIEHVACDTTGTNCAGVGHMPGDGETDCGPNLCEIPVAFYTTDKGNLWHQSFIYRKQSYGEFFHFLDGIACDKIGKRCTAVGAVNVYYRYSTSPLTYVSNNGGQRWYLSLVQPEVNHTENDTRYYYDGLMSVSCDSAGNECVTVGYYGYGWQYSSPMVYISHEGGNTWIKASKMPAPPALFSLLNYVDCDFNTKVCHAKGYYQDSYKDDAEKHPMAFVSQDLGDTWQRE